MIKKALRFIRSFLNKSNVALGLALISGSQLLGAPALKPSQPTERTTAADPPQKAAVRFGARLGMNAANMNFNQGYPQPAVPIQTTWKPGVVAGFFWQLPLRKKLFLQQEYLFSQMGGAVKSSGTTYQLRYLSLPLLLQYELLPKLIIAAGPQFDLLIQAKQQTNGATTSITHDTEERSVGATVGLDFRITKNLGLDARYMQGLNHIGIGQRSDVQEFKYQMVQVAAVLRF